jgi:hypothetical protein
MNPHFLWQQDHWIGEGNVSFSHSQEKIRFFTRWQVQKALPDTIQWLQEVELHGLQQTTNNYFTISDLKDGHFKIVLENDIMGKIIGKGVIDHRIVAWELRDRPGMEGYEIYELQDNGDYHFRAEYASPDRFHTCIEGRIWKKGLDF